MKHVMVSFDSFCEIGAVFVLRFNQNKIFWILALHKKANFVVLKIHRLLLKCHKGNKHS